MLKIYLEASNRILRVKHLILSKIQNMMGINTDLLQWFINILKKNLPTPNISRRAITNENMSHQQSAEELLKPMIRKFEKRKVCSSFKDNI